MSLYLGGEGDFSCRALLPVRIPSENLIQSWWPSGPNNYKGSTPTSLLRCVSQFGPHHFIAILWSSVTMLLLFPWKYPHVWYMLAQARDAEEKPESPDIKAKYTKATTPRSGFLVTSEKIPEMCFNSSAWVTKKVKPFPRVHLRIIPSLGEWILLAPKPIKINGKRGLISLPEILRTNPRVRGCYVFLHHRTREVESLKT